MHLGRNISYECLVNQSVLHQVKMKLVMVYLKENNREIKFHLKKGTEKVVLLQGLIEIIVKFRAENFFYAYISCTKHSFEGHETLWIERIVWQHSI